MITINQLIDFSCILYLIADSVDFDLWFIIRSIYFVIKNIDIFVITDVCVNLMSMNKKFRCRTDALISSARKARLEAGICKMQYAINGSITAFHSRHFVRHLGICKWIFLNEFKKIPKKIPKTIKTNLIKKF